MSKTLHSNLALSLSATEWKFRPQKGFVNLRFILYLLMLKFEQQNLALKWFIVSWFLTVRCKQAATDSASYESINFYKQEKQLIYRLHPSVFFKQNLQTNINEIIFQTCFVGRFPTDAAQRPTAAELESRINDLLTTARADEMKHRDLSNKSAGQTDGDSLFKPREAGQYLRSENSSK